MNRTVSFHSPPYLFLRSFFRVFNPLSLGTSSSCVPSQSSNDCFETSMPIYSVIRNLLVYEESLQWVALPYAFHFVHNPNWKNLLPLLIHHKLWKGDPSLVQAHEDLSLLQCTYGLPIPLSHTTWNSTPPSYEMYVKDDRRALALEMRKEQRGWCSQCGNKPFFGDFISPAVCLRL